MIQDPILNNIPEFIDRYQGFRLIVLNGIIARRYFDRLLKGSVINVVTLPSTSPAHARLTIGEKTDRWRIICPYLK
jgi:G:T/U-mismatch repair DNA glycosylase